MKRRRLLFRKKVGSHELPQIEIRHGSKGRIRVEKAVECLVKLYLTFLRRVLKLVRPDIFVDILDHCRACYLFTLRKEDRKTSTTSRENT